MLDVHLDQLDLDEETIRSSCVGILQQSNEILGCEEMIERLEAEGKVWPDLSPDVLGSLLRSAETFQEIGKNRFRLKPCPV